MRIIRNNLFFILLLTLLFSCKSTSSLPNEQELKNPEDEITLLFAGDIMAHSINYRVSSYDKIWQDVKNLIEPCDLAFANIEAPIDRTQETQSYPYFNMNEEYVQAAIDAGFNVFSLCNNHTNDQNLTGIKETIKTTSDLVTKNEELKQPVYFSGLKENKEDSFSFNIIEQNGWKILFLPITELLNRPIYNQYINYIVPNKAGRQAFVEFVKQLKEENPCDLFVLSVHTSEPEYVRGITENQNNFYHDLLDAGVDIVWANHAHIIKDRRYVYNQDTKTTKVIMYANGNTISGQRTKPDFSSANPIEERDNTGDGLMIRLTFQKNKKDSTPRLSRVDNYFITTYINSNYEYVVEPMNSTFIEYLYENSRPYWADYIKRRMKINTTYTRDLLEWQ